MLKKDLLNLIVNLQDEDHVDEAVKGSELVKKFSDLEAFKSKINEADFKSFIDSEKDIHASKSLETWKTNNLQKEVEALYKKNHPDADPKDLELNKLKADFEAMKNESTKKELVNKALKLAQEKKLPIELVDYFIGADEATTISNLAALEKTFSAHIEAVVAERLKGTYTPPKDKPLTGEKNPWSKEHFNLTEQGKILTTNPELAKTLMANK